MGDRANVQMRYGDHEPLYFYTHWGGDTLPHKVKAALEKRWRWEDASYLARIIFCEMVKGEEGTETGYGIAPYVCDNEHKVVVVDTKGQRVGFAPTTYTEGKGDVVGEPTKWWTFDNYIKLTEKQIDKAYGTAE